MPLAVQAAFRASVVQTLSLVVKPSARTSLTESLKMGCGSSRRSSQSSASRKTQRRARGRSRKSGRPFTGADKLASANAGFVADLHVHTTGGSADASLRPTQLVTAAAGLHAVGITEHFRHWSSVEAEAAQGKEELVILRGQEFSTSLGHILAFGLEGFSGDGRDPNDLRVAAERHGALLVAAHPFRYFFRTATQNYHPSDLRTTDPDEAARLPIFSYVHAVEGLNGHCTPEENAFAIAVAERLGFPLTAGSDAHYADELGRCVTRFRTKVNDLQELISAILEGKNELLDLRVNSAAEPAVPSPETVRLANA